MKDLRIKLKEYINHEDQFIQDTVNEILMLNEKLENKKLTEDQFNELTNDLLELQEIRKLRITFERKTMLLQTLTTITNIIRGII